jgi:hypothetical protein
MARAPVCLPAKNAQIRKPVARLNGCAQAWPPTLAKVRACQDPICTRIFRENFIYRPKWLIDKGFENDPKFLWITLLTACQSGSESPIYQGFEHNARKFGSLLIRSKSRAYKKTKRLNIYFLM